MTYCFKCDEYLYYYPAKLVLETTKDSIISNRTRIISLSCNTCGRTGNYEFPEEFEKIN